MKTNNQRLLALDVLRGITISGMILVNDPGSGSVYTPLEHSSWNGLTPTDLVFPFFMFIMGVSTYISLKKYGFEYSGSAMWKIVKRTLVIFAIGLGLVWFSMFCSAWSFSANENLTFWELLGKSVWTFDHIRILGVLQRLALSYGFAAVIAILVRHKYIPYIILSLLVGYTLILLFGNGYEYNETSILSIVDRAVLGLQHMYKDNGIDPEGLLSTIPSIAHVLIGFSVGKWLMGERDIRDKMLRLFLLGTILTFLGFLLNYGLPINKKVWSPSFVLVTCGLASNFLALLIWIIDVKGYKKWSRFFEAFGINPLFMYMIAWILSTLLGNIHFTYNDAAISLHGFAYKVLLQPVFGDYLGSLVFAILFVCVVWICGYTLYKKKIYIKI